MKTSEFINESNVKTSLEKFSLRTSAELESLAINTASNDYVSGNLVKKKLLGCLYKSIKDYMDCLGGLNKSHGDIYLLAKRLFVINYLRQANSLLKSA